MSKVKVGFPENLQAMPRSDHIRMHNPLYPSFLYDFVKCEGDAELEQTIQTIDDNGYNLVSVTQSGDT